MGKKQKTLHRTFCLAGGIWCVLLSKSHVPDVIRYIQNQEVHHKKQNFLDEYRQFLKVFEIDYDEQYIFKELE